MFVHEWKAFLLIIEAKKEKAKHLFILLLVFVFLYGLAFQWKLQA